jgi:antitoxin CptB
MVPNETTQDIERERSYWRSRRGLLELDLLLPPFVKSRYDALPDEHKGALRRLLECEDQDIWDWYQRRSAPNDAGVAQIIELIRSFNDGPRANGD